MLTAECYKQRMEKGLSFLEFNYMIMQSYDFLKLYENYGCNMQFGGDDQWSNMLGGTELIRRKLGKDASVRVVHHQRLGAALLQPVAELDETAHLLFEALAVVVDGLFQSERPSGPTDG